MKRHPCLVPLSDDHHRALVLARRLKREGAPSGAALAALADEVRRVFDSELEPHFQVEEQLLVPPLERAGAGALTRRLREDHAELRRRIRRDWAPADVVPLGALLEAHVRFEERVLFPEAEARLSPAALEAIRAARIGSSGSPPAGS